MTRSTSPVDSELAERASAAGYPTSARQVERWRQRGLIPANERRSAGRGSTSVAAEGAPELVTWLAENARRGRRPLDLALLAFGEGLAVPEATVRKAFLAAVGRIRLTTEDEAPEGTSPEDIADAAVRSGTTGTVLQARVRNIDQALATYGLDDLSRELRDLDLGSRGEPVTPTSWVYNTAVAMLAGGGELTVEQLGEMARSVMPRSLAAPFASDMEQQWPDNEAERAALLNESGGLTLFPEGDLRQLMADLASTLTVAELMSGWKAAAQLTEWAEQLCEEVEAEIAAEALGAATREWMIGAVIGPARMLLTVGLRDVDSGPADLAVTALLLLWMRDRICDARTLVPNGEFEHLKIPGVLPPCFLHLLTESNILEPS